MFKTAKDKQQSRKISSVVIAVIVGIIVTVALLLYGTYCLVDAIFGGIISFIIMNGIQIFGVKYIIRSMLFMGSVKLMRRTLEYDFMVNRAKILKGKLKCLLSLIESIESNNSYLLIDYSSSELKGISERIITMVNTYNTLAGKTQLSNAQAKFSNAIGGVYEQLKKVYLNAGNAPFTVWQLLESSELLSELKNSSASCAFQSDTVKNDLKTALMESDDILESIISASELPLKKRFNHWYYDDTFGTLAFFKAELTTIYKTKEVSLKSFDGKILDCMLIYGQTKEDKDTDQDQPAELQENIPTIIFANPNAGFYEFSRYSNEWVDFYQKKGINVFLWNYRGYGKSQGCPSPQNIFRDGESVVNYLRAEPGIGALGVHGQSLGGMVACHIASTMNLDFLCADRTFSCVSDIVLHSMPRLAKIVFRMSTNYDTWTPVDYINSRCYKVLAFDINDEIIPFQASLLNGVTKHLAQNMRISTASMMGLDSSSLGQLYHQKGNEDILKNPRGFFIKTFTTDNTVQISLNQMSIPEDEQKQLFNSLRRIVFMVMHYQASKKKVTPAGNSSNSQSSSKENDKDQSKNNQQSCETPSKKITANIELSQIANNNDTQSRDTKNNQKDALNSSLDTSSVINGSFLVDSIRDEEQKAISQGTNTATAASANSFLFAENNINNNNNLGDISNTSALSPKSELDKTDIENQQKPNPSSQVELAGFGQETQQNDSKDKDKNTSEEDSYAVSLCEESCVFSGQLTKLFKSLYSLLSTYDAAGLTLLDVFTLFYSSQTFKLYQLFLINLNVWGSYLPLNQIIRKNLTGTMPKKYAIAKTKEVVRKIEKISRDNAVIPGVPDQILASILGDLSVISEKLRNINEKLQIQQSSFQQSKLSQNNNSDKGIFNSLGNKDAQGDNKMSNIEDLQTNTEKQTVSLSSGQNTPEKKKIVDQQGELRVYEDLKEESIIQQTQIMDQQGSSNQYVGNLLPVSCGHNGNYSNFEMQLFQFHLKNAGFLKD